MTERRYLELAEAAWRWVLDQVRWDDEGPWLPESPGVPLKADYRDGMHSGIGSLAYALAELRHLRDWTAEERRLAGAIADRLTRGIPTATDSTSFDGLVSAIGVLTMLDAPGADAAVDRLLALATPDGWPQAVLDPAKYLPDARINDVTLGTAGVLLGALWAGRNGARNARELAEHAAMVLMAEREKLPTGLNWLFVPRRFYDKPVVEMPNFSHGVAGVATALALAGAELDRPDLTAAAVAGAEHLITLGRVDDSGFAVPHYIPNDHVDVDEFTYNWCHGPAGTSLLFDALDHAGVTEVAGDPPQVWHRRCLDSIRASGIPARPHPGFWDNDGRCCGTAGVAETFLNAWHRSHSDADLTFARHLSDTLADRALRDGPHAYWRFTEHRAADPLLPPGTGLMQGATGIAAHLLHAHTLTPTPHLTTWWTITPPAHARYP